MDLKYRTAVPADSDEIIALINSATDNMIKNNIFQWDEIYPDKHIVEEDIRKKQLTVGTDNGKIVVIYTLNIECDEGYTNGEWKYTDSSYCVVHRLCVNPEYQNKGIGRQTMLRIENEARKMGVTSIRLDTFSENPYALKLYKNLGFRTAGYAYWRKGKFMLMEKIL